VAELAGADGLLPDPIELVPALRGASIATAARGGGIDAEAITPFAEELDLVATAGPDRRAEVLTGRTLARAALAEIGGPEGPIGRRPDRSPDWPDGFGGSITHAGGWCLVVVARLPAGWGLGIDVEEDRPLTADVAARVLLPTERTHLAGGTPSRGETLAFSAKESVFKAVNPLTGRWLEHHDVGVALRSGAVPDVGDFEVSWPGRGQRALADLVLDGRWVRAGGLVASGCVVRPRS
jgi:4'-phosphopantetheinyl transferase EntD